MWARRCGAPARWPSRIKVVLFSFLNGAIGLSIYQFMAALDIGHLNLSSPDPSTVFCLTEWPLRDDTITWARPDEWINWFQQMNSDYVDEWRDERWCRVPKVSGEFCSKIVVPLNDMQRPLARAMAGDVLQRYDVLGGWAHWFLLITFGIWLSITVHDLALISDKKHAVLDVPGVNKQFPMIRTCWRNAAGYRWVCPLLASESGGIKVLGIVLLIVAMPLLVVWNILVFNFAVIPVFLCIVLLHPIKFSRIVIFLLGLLCCLYGLGLTVQQMVFMIDPETRPRYGVTWTEGFLDPPFDPAAHVAANVTAPTRVWRECICGCNYAVSSNTCFSLLVAGVVVTIKAFFVLFRTLKGLRRSNWANLISVLFAIPLTVYVVEWRRPDGSPIQHRDENMPEVQGEIAFDPFALMDEQPDSAFTTCHLRPATILEHSVSTGGHVKDHMNQPRLMQTPQLKFVSKDGINVEDAEYIGCCGFPWATGGKKYVYSDSFMAKVEEEYSPSRSPQSYADDEVRDDIFVSIDDTPPPAPKPISSGDAELQFTDSPTEMTAPKTCNFQLKKGASQKRMSNSSI